MAPPSSQLPASTHSNLPAGATMTVCQVVVDPWAFNLNAVLVIIFGLTTLMMQLIAAPFRDGLFKSVR